MRRPTRANTRTKRKNPVAHAIVRSRFFISHSGPSEDTLAAYRLMGLDLDATYDEIEAAFNDLTAQYAVHFVGGMQHGPEDPKRLRVSAACKHLYDYNLTLTHHLMR